MTTYSSTGGDRLKDKPDINIYGVIDSTYFSRSSNINVFIDIIYKNFSDLAYDPNLKHNIPEIKKLLTSPTFRGLLVFKSGKIVGYLLSDIIKLNDGRTALFINYIFVGKQFRKLGLADKMINTMIDYCKKHNIESIMLIYDTENLEMERFYSKRGFMLDLVLRRYARYDVFTKLIN
jgi:ribosomal protein S18 acetylase RimI-like enzyme